MTTYQRFVICLFFLLLLCVKTNDPAIGTILNPNSRFGREKKIVIGVATGRCNSSSQVIIFNAINLGSSSPRRAPSKAQRLIQQSVQVITSRGTWPQMLIISDVGEQLEVPIVSLAPSSVLIKPFLVQLSYQDSVLLNYLAHLVNDYGTVSGTQLLGSALQQVRSLIHYAAIFSSMESISDSASSIQGEPDRMIQHLSMVYTILRSSENLMCSLLREANTYGMMQKGSAWICEPDVTTLLDTSVKISISITGFCVDVLSSALERLNSSNHIDFFPFTIEKNLAYEDLLNEVYLKKFEVAVGDITITSSRSEKALQNNDTMIADSIDVHKSLQFQSFWMLFIFSGAVTATTALIFAIKSCMKPGDEGNQHDVHDRPGSQDDPGEVPVDLEIVTVSHTELGNAEHENDLVP